MLTTVDVGMRRLDAYSGVAPEAMLADVRKRAERVRGARVVHINATPYGGGVSELLRSVVPLLNDLGLVADWKVITGDEAFFRVTKTIHNALQGAAGVLEASAVSVYESNARRNAALLEEKYDFVFVHDPQPAGILAFHGKGDARWVWRCHIDTSHPNPAVWGILRAYLSDYDAAVFTMAEFVPADLPIARCEIIPPAIDPLNPKNLPLDDVTARQILEWIGIHGDRPLVTQVSRFDPWKDPFGVIAAYRLAREVVPDLQLALVGSMALDDPEGWEIYRGITAESAGDPLMHVLTNLTGVGNIEVNAFQRLSDVIVQKSLREGFGLVVSEALWKGTPVVAGRAGGIPLQMADGVGGVLIETVEDCAVAIGGLLQDRERRRELGRRGRERVREHFLLPRLLLNELVLLEQLAAARPLRITGEWEGSRDPVCGMAIPGGVTAPTEIIDDRTYAFCSQACRARFRRAPGHYVGGALGSSRMETSPGARGKPA